VRLDAKATGWNQAFFTNNAMPAWAIVVKNGILNQESEEAIKAMFDTEFKGETKAHRALLLSANTGAEIDFEQLQTRPTDMGLVDLKNISLDEIIAAHGVPPRLLGVVTPGQLGGGGEMAGQFKFFAECVIKTRQHMLGQWLQPLLPTGLAIRFQEMDVTALQEDAEYFDKMIAAGVLLPNEVRADLGYEPLAGADEAAMARGLRDAL
jgi:HK97 family phage portal protein